MAGAPHKGTYLVQLHKHQIVDHFVVVIFNLLVVLDSSERFPFNISAEFLSLCGFDAATRLVFCEVRELVPQK